MIRPTGFLAVAVARAEAALGRPLTAAERGLAGLAPPAAAPGDWLRSGEAGRAAMIAAAATLPPECGDVPHAPARAWTGMRIRRHDRLVSAATGRSVAEAVAVTGDIWDRMECAALARHTRRGGAAAAFVPPVPLHLVAVARTYRAVVERHAAAGLRFARLDAPPSGHAAGGGGAADALLAEGRWIARLRAAVGGGVSLRDHRRRHLDRAPGRAIAHRILVDAVCLGDRSISGVLVSHGWPAKGLYINLLRADLVAALHRMSTLPPAAPQGLAGEA